METDWPALWQTIQAADPHATAAELGVPLDEIKAGVERPHSRRRLYRVTGDTYIQAVPSQPAAGERAPFSFYWAASEGAALRAACGLRGSDDGARADPPAELLIEPGLSNRAALERWVRENQPRYSEEGFAGFSPLSGAYVRLAQLVYHFRSIRWDPDEVPYVIEYDPRPAEPLFRKLAAFHLGRQ